MAFENLENLINRFIIALLIEFMFIKLNICLIIYQK